MELKESIDNKKIVIYGAGVKAKALSQELLSSGIGVDCFVISDGKNTSGPDINIDVLTISEWYMKHSDSKEDYLFLIAVNSVYYLDIKIKLDELSLRSIYISDEDLQGMVRENKRVDERQFICDFKPVSELFGFDRGKPIDRWYIEQFLSEQSRGFSGVSRTMEVAEDTYSKLFFPEADNEILSYENGQDLTDVKTLECDQYDVFIATQVFNFIYDVRRAIAGAHHLLRAGGVLLATVAGCVSPISQYDMDRWGDYWRFTDLSIRRLVNEVFGDCVDVITYGNAASATAFIQGLAVEDLSSPDILVPKDPRYSVCIGVVARKK